MPRYIHFNLFFFNFLYWKFNWNNSFVGKCLKIENICFYAHRIFLIVKLLSVRFFIYWQFQTFFFYCTLWSIRWRYCTNGIYCIFVGNCRMDSEVVWKVCSFHALIFNMKQISSYLISSIHSFYKSFILHMFHFLLL